MFDLHNDESSTLNLSKFSQELTDGLEENKIEIKQKVSSIFHKSRADAKLNKCYYCNKKITDFCNSHSVPASFLRNISFNGELFSNNKLFKLPIMKEELGIKKTGIFNMICKECDSKIFRDYENFNYCSEPSQKMLAQISLKNYLRNISKRLFEMSLYENMENEYHNGFAVNMFSEMERVNKLDLNEFILGFKRAKKIIDKNWNDGYYLFFYKKLDYVVSLAYQGTLALPYDLEGKKINDIYNKSPDYKLKMLHICVFPLKEYSCIILFIDSNDAKRYRMFYKQFKELNLENQLSAINYMIFSLSEDTFIDNRIDQSVFDNSNLKQIAGETGHIYTYNPTTVNKDQISQNNFNFLDRDKIPNLLVKQMLG